VTPTAPLAPKPLATLASGAHRHRGVARRTTRFMRASSGSRDREQTLKSPGFKFAEGTL
jgi:hypothetical protein